jgi:hypothetical protein
MAVRAVRNVAVPNFPVAPPVYSRANQDQFINVLRLHLNNIANNINAPKVHGAFYDTTTQTNPVASAENLMTFDSVIMAYGTKIGSPTSRVYVAETGVYNIQFSAQMDKSGGGSGSAYIWLKVNGTAVANSASKIVISGPSAETIAAWNFVIILSGNSYFELAWSSPDTTMLILHEAAADPIPAIPSVILTVTWVSNIPV